MSNKVFFNEKNKNKREYLLNTIFNNINRTKKYNLHITSCYLPNNLKELKKFIFLILNKINVNSINFYVDSRQVIKSGIIEIEKLIESIERNKRVNTVSFYVIDKNSLFHTKALALISCNGLQNGFLFIGSSNFSTLGILGKAGNFESGLFSTNIDDVNDFLSSIPTPSTLAKFKEKSHSSNEYTFKYAVVHSGFFIHKWQQTLSQYLSIRYTLSEKGKAEVVSDTFKRLSFSVDTETISRQFIDIDEISKNLGINSHYSNLRRKGIETYLGYWIPKSMVHSNIDSKRIPNELKENVKLLLDKQINEYKEEINRTYQELLNEGLIEPTNKDVILSLNEKITELFDQSNEEKLRRFLYRFDLFDCPYDIAQKNQIEDLYEILESSISSNKRKKESIKRLCIAIEKEDPNMINENE